MMKASMILGSFILLLSACIFPRERYRKSQFTFNRQGEAVTVPLLVPRGFSRVENTDTAGVSLQTFYYPNGAMLYAAFLRDTTMELQPIDRRMHQPRIHMLGGQVYKGQDERELFYREIRQGHVRYGYRLVPGSAVLLFDSATNHASLQKR